MPQKLSEKELQKIKNIWGFPRSSTTVHLLEDRLYLSEKPAKEGDGKEREKSGTTIVSLWLF